MGNAYLQRITSIFVFNHLNAMNKLKISQISDSNEGLTNWYNVSRVCYALHIIYQSLTCLAISRSIPYDQWKTTFCVKIDKPGSYMYMYVQRINFYIHSYTCTCMYLESFKSQYPPISICHTQAAYLVRFPVQIQSNLSIIKLDHHQIVHV
jgi:hypothetical protein